MTNPELDKAKKTHLIEESDSFGIWEDDYKSFIKAHGKWVLGELGHRL